MESTYNQKLDGLRAICISLVLIEHFVPVINRNLSLGYFGVDFFFVISGYLITKILLKTNEPFFISYKKFIGRRTLRIFPLYYFTIILLYIFGDNFVHKYFIYCITYTYNYALIFYNLPNNIIRHFWSLCVEEQFYLFWPILVLALRKNLVLLSIIIISLVVFCYCQTYFNIIEKIKLYNEVGLIPRAASLGLGALGTISIFENKYASFLLNSKKIEYLIISLLLFFIVTNYSVKYLFCPILFLFLILKTNKNFINSKFLNNILNNKSLVNLGKISYGVYLFHIPLSFYFTNYVFDPLIWSKINFEYFETFKILKWHSWILKFPLCTFLSILVASISYKYFETPILGLKDKWFKYDFKKLS